MKPYEIHEKLRNFETVFPNKSSIKLAEAKQYLEGAIGKELDDNYVRSFLEALGFQKIESHSASKHDEDLELDDILNMDWSPQTDGQSLQNALGTHSYNTHLLIEYHTEQDSKAFDQLVVDNINLVHKVASRYLNYVNHQLSFDDLVSEGVIGLMKAIKKFDISKEVQFSTYAVWWVRQQISRAVADTGTMVRIPVHMFENVLRIKRAELPYLLHGESPNLSEICSTLNITLSTYEKAKLIEHQFLTITSTEQFVSNEDQDTELGEFLSVESHRVLNNYDETFYNPSLLAEQNDVRLRIRETILKHLKPREQEIIFERFGFIDNKSKTLEQIGRKFGLTRERIRQIEAKAIKKLQVRMTKKSVRDDFQWPEETMGW